MMLLINMELIIFLLQNQRIDAKGNVKEYNSVMEAAKDFPDKAIEIARKNISRGLNAHKTAYGYKWMQI